ncbi:MAG: hypothetical protein J6Y00_07880 [Paludibacteraceae bacterium]|nr:hypothetical protein [Paludibacteraceae bacterium]
MKSKIFLLLLCAAMTGNLLAIPGALTGKFSTNKNGTEKVAEGETAEGWKPEPEREGYDFTGWSKPLTNITSDLSVQAQYEKKEPTALDAAEGTDSRAARKLLRNGILLIERNGTTYTVQGKEQR